MAPTWSTELGSLSTRAELALQYGGSRYSGGIVPAEASKCVFLFSDPEEGAKYGYNFDGFGPDGAYYYTGQGSAGDHKLDGSNGSVLNHELRGRTLRLFVADGVISGTRTKLQRYVGEFRIDAVKPYAWHASPDSNQVTRAVLVFRLLAADTTLPVSTSPTDAIKAIDVRMVPPEVNSTHFYESSGTQPTIAEKNEAGLVGEFSTWLSLPSYSLKRWAIKIPGSSLPLLSDIYDVSSRTLYEAKSTSSRNDVRMAIGQLIDYRRHIPVENMTCSLLLPSQPHTDLVDLAHHVGMAVTFRSAPGQFKIA